MVKDDGQKEDKFDDFTPEGEALGYISLDQARVLVMRTARETPGAYGDRLTPLPMAFEVMAEEETEDHYVITLSFRPQGAFTGTPGEEQFFVEKEGVVAHRQVLSLPEPAGRRFPVIPVLIVLVVVAVGAVVGVLFANGSLGGTPEEAAVAEVGASIAPAAAAPATGSPVLPSAVGPTPQAVGAPAPVRPTATAVPVPTRQSGAGGGASPAAAATGELEAQVIWNLPFPGGTEFLATGPTEGLVVSIGVGGEDHKILFIDGVQGTVRWTIPLQGLLAGAVVSANGPVYVAIGPDLLGLHSADGSVLTKSVPGPGVLWLALGPAGELYAVSEDGTLFRIPSDGGDPVWRVDLGLGVDAAPVVGPAGTVYVGTIGPAVGALYAVSPDGVTLWKTDVGPIEFSPAVGPSGVYVANADPALISFDENDGSIRWRFDIKPPVAPPAVASDGSVDVLTVEGLYRFSAQGELLWTAQAFLNDGRPVGLAEGADGIAYVVTQGGNLWAVDPNDPEKEGKLFWEPEGRWLAAGPEGILYVGSSESITAVRVVAVPSAAFGAVGGLRWMHSENTADVYRDLDHRLVEEINTRAGGAADIKLEISEESGVAAIDIFALVAQGEVQIATAPLRGAWPFLPHALGLDLPSLYQDVGMAIEATSAFKPELDLLLQAKANVKLLTLWPSDPQVLYCRGPFTTVPRLHTLNGKQVYVEEDDSRLLDTMNLVQANPVGLPVNDVYGKLEGGHIDCAVGGTWIGNERRWYEVTDELHTLPLSWDFHTHIVNLDVWNASDDELRALLEATSLKQEQEFLDQAKQLASSGIACNTGDAPNCLRQTVGNMVLVEPEDEDHALLRQLLLGGVIPEWLDRCGGESAPSSSTASSPLSSVSRPSAERTLSHQFH